jgi:hypothetical protein
MTGLDCGTEFRTPAYPVMKRDEIAATRQLMMTFVIILFY